MGKIPIVLIVVTQCYCGLAIVIAWMNRHFFSNSLHLWAGQLHVKRKVYNSPLFSSSSFSQLSFHKFFFEVVRTTTKINNSNNYTTNNFNISIFWHLLHPIVTAIRFKGISSTIASASTSKVSSFFLNLIDQALHISNRFILPYTLPVKQTTRSLYTRLAFFLQDTRKHLRYLHLPTTLLYQGSIVS